MIKARVNTIEQLRNGEEIALSAIEFASHDYEITDDCTPHFIALITSLIHDLRQTNTKHYCQGLSRKIISRDNIFFLLHVLRLNRAIAIACSTLKIVCFLLHYYESNAVRHGLYE